MRPLFIVAIAALIPATPVPAIAPFPKSIPISQSIAFIPPSKTIDEAAISTIIQSVATFADQGYFEALESLFADHIQTDYTSLFGGEIQGHTPESLMTAWASLLPGFDQTYHDISNIQVNIEGGVAEATADVIASHYLDDQYWQVSGQYNYQLVRRADAWKVEVMTFTLNHEVGDRALLEKASAVAAENPNSYLQLERVAL
ncbi:MAG: nuclear transport factor 2 family protein [Cyanobacteria bacterium P01_F01_bin.150]